MTVIAAMLLGAGFVLQQHAAAQVPSDSFLHLRLIAQLLHKRIWLVGIAIMVAGQGLSAWALGHLSLTVSEPLLTTNLIFALLLAAPIYGEVPRRTEIAGALLLSAGVAALSVSRSVRALSESFGSFSHWPAAGLIAAIAALLVIAGRNGPASLRATLTGAGAGLLLGISDALTRRSVEIIDAHGLGALLTTWPGYAVVGTAAVGLWLTQSAFSAGPLHASLPAITGAEPLSGMALGVLVFGDEVHVTPWLLGLQAAGVAAMVGGVILVAQAPVFGQLHLRQTAAHLAQEARKITTGEIPLVRTHSGEHARVSGADRAGRSDLPASGGQAEAGAADLPAMPVVRAKPVTRARMAIARVWRSWFPKARPTPPAP
ncbi:MAG TPA: DMT family transporter [Streptosporangiaceae bacterium]